MVSLRVRGRAVSGSLSLSLEECDVALETLNLDRGVYPYEIPFDGRTVEERTRHRSDVLAALANRGLARGGEVTADVRGALEFWVAPEVLLTLEARYIETGDNYLYRAGWDDKRGFVTHQDGYDVRFRSLLPGQVVRAMLAYLPDQGPAFGQPVTVTSPPPPPVNTGGESAELFGSVSRVSSRGEAAARRFFASPLRMMGQFTLSTRDGRGYKQHGIAQWYDTDAGRFMITTERAPDGAVRRTITPTDGHHLSTWVYGCLDRR
jgi:hypothetical protein